MNTFIDAHRHLHGVEPISRALPIAPLEAPLKRERMIDAAALVLIAALSWAATARLAFDMKWMMSNGGGWDAVYFGAMFLMWVVMMMAMMLPSATPTILLFAALEQQGGR